MAQSSIDPEILETVVSSLKKANGQLTVAAELAATNLSTFKSRVRIAVEQGLISPTDVKRMRTKARGPALYEKLPQTADACWAALDNAIGRTRAQPKPPKYRSPKTKRIAIASDFHAPFHHPAAVAQLLKETEGYDQLIINGDLQDSYSVSRFTKHEVVPWEREVAALDALLATFAERYPDIVVVDGNHDKPRFEKSLRSQVPIEIVHVIEFLTGGEFSTIRCLSKRKGYQNIRFAPIKVGRHSVTWAAQEGDLLVTHAEAYSKVPGSALRKIEAWMSDLEDVLGLDDWRVVVQGHTHTMGWFPWKSRKLLVEGGCMCYVHGYQLDAKIAGTGQRLGFVTLTQTDGVTDLASVRPHWIDPVVRP